MQHYFFGLDIIQSSLPARSCVLTLGFFFGNEISPFSNSFCINCLFMFYFVCCCICALNFILGGSKFNCFLVALLEPDMCSWPKKSNKNFDGFGQRTFVGPSAQMLFKLKGTKFDSNSIFFQCIDEKICVIFNWNFFHQWVSF